jgi:hypothetical protein
MSETAAERSSEEGIERTKGLEPFALAAGLLWNDRFLLLPLLIVLAMAGLADLALQSFGISNWTGVMVLDRVLQILVVTFIVLRWRKRLQVTQAAPLNGTRLAARIAIVSITSTVLLAVPFLGFAVNPGGASALLFLVCGVLGVVWCLRVYFYFAVVGILGSPVVAGLARAVLMSKGDGMAALRSLVVPCALTMLLTALLTMPSPDGRSVVWMTAASSAEGIFWILSTYSALGYALAMFNESEWRTAGLTPYRRERLSTIQMQGGATLARYLRPKFGLWMCLGAMCCMAANLARQVNEPPAASVVVKSVTVADYLIKVELEVEDREYKFRGFHPMAFSVKSKTGFAIANSMTAASLTADGTGFIGPINSKDGAQQRIFLTFSSGKTAAALRALDNVWLWYQFQPLVAISPQMLQPVAPEATV